MPAAWTDIPCSDLPISSSAFPTLSCVVLSSSADLPPQAEISVCGWMRAHTWRMPCQSWESCVQLPDGGFFSLCGCECLSENRSGAEWAWLPGCGSDFLLVSVPVSVPTYAALGDSACLNKHTFVSVHVLYMQISLAPHMLIRAHVSVYFGFLLMPRISTHASMYPGSGCEPMWWQEWVCICVLCRRFSFCISVCPTEGCLS